MNYEVVKYSSSTIYIIKVINTVNSKMIKKFELDISKNDDTYIMFTIIKVTKYSIIEVDGIEYEVNDWTIEGNNIKIFVNVKE